MTPNEASDIHSFLLVFYDAALQEVARFHLPVSVVAPFTNRLFAEAAMRPVGSSKLCEPWYTLTSLTGQPCQRAPLPPGLTSLSGEPYDPAAETGPVLQMHPQARLSGFEVRLMDLQQELYRGIYTVEDIFRHAARYLLDQRLPGAQSAGSSSRFFYQILPSAELLRPAEGDPLEEVADAGPGVFRLPPPSPQRSRIKFQPLPEPPPPERALDSFGSMTVLGKGAPQAGLILLHPGVHRQLCHDLPLDTKDEQGGYLLGNVYRQPGSPPHDDDPDLRWLVELTDVVPAEFAVGTPVQLLFTGASGSEFVRRRERDYAGRKLVGWYHSHVFPASDEFGLSGLDQQMHAWYLPSPWHVALLLNLEQDGGRTLRCYQRGPEKLLVETPYQVLSS